MDIVQLGGNIGNEDTLVGRLINPLSRNKLVAVVARQRIVKDVLAAVAAAIIGAAAGPVLEHDLFVFFTNAGAARGAVKTGDIRAGHGFVPDHAL